MSDGSEGSDYSDSDEDFRLLIFHLAYDISQRWELLEVVVLKMVHRGFKIKKFKNCMIDSWYNDHKDEK